MGKALIQRFFIILAIFQCQIFTGQTSYHIESVGNDQVFNSVNSVVQDSLGFLWIGTNEGLLRYDGYEFIPFKGSYGRNNILPKNRIQSLYLSRKGDLWVSSGGLTRYDYAKNSFILLENVYDTTTHNKNKQDPWNITEDAEGRIWYHTSNLITCYDLSSKKFFNYSSSFNEVFVDKKELPTIDAIAVDKKNNLWISYQGYHINKVSLQSPERIFHYTLPFNKLSPPKINHIYCDREDNILITASDGLYFLKDTVFQKLSFSFKIEDAEALIQFHPDEYWAATSSGLFLLHRNGSHFTSDQITQKKIKSLFYDHSQVLWIGTEAGLDKIDLTQKPFHVIKQEDKNVNSLLGNHITAIYQSADADLWVGTTDGLTRVNRQLNKCTRYSFQSERPHILVSNKVFTINEIDDNLYIGGVGLQQADFERTHFSYAHPDEKDTESINDWIVWDIFKSKKSGNIWLATNGGFCKINTINHNTSSSIPVKMNNRFRRYQYLTQQTKRPVGCFSIMEDSRGIIWCGTLNGLLRYDPATNEYKMIVLDPTFYSISVRCVFEDSKGRIWAGSDGMGLNLIDREKLTFTSYREKEGFPSDVAWKIEEDAKGYLWISTNKGLCRFDPRKKFFRTFNTRDGLPGNEFTPGASFKSSSGELFFGTTKGFISFFPDSIKDNPVAPKIVLTRLLVFNKPVDIGEEVNGDIILESSISIIKDIFLTHKNNVFSIEFTGLHFANTENNKFCYKLDGFDKIWTQVGSDRRIAYYSNLEPGEYHFYVKAANADGVWSESASLTIHILSPFWKTWWFRSLFILALFSMFWSIYKIRIRTLEHQRNTLENTVQERTAELRDANIILSSQKEELAQQSVSLQEKNVMLQERQSELEAAAEEIRAQSDELHVANEELLKLNATKDRFFSIIGHDLKNPFHAILSFSDLLKTRFEELDDNTKKEFINAIKDSSEGAYKLLQNLLDWARSQTNKITIEWQPIQLNELVKETIQLLALSAEKKKIRMVNEVAENAYVKADRNMITTVIRNIVNNAIKFTPDNGRIYLRTEFDSSLVRLSICDTGVGMSQEVIDNLFRIDKPHSTTGTSGEMGTGLGLIICNDFVNKNNGKLIVKSEINKGTCFIIEFEGVFDHISKQEEAAKKNNDEPAFIEPEENTEEKTEYHLLIVDDDAKIRQSIKHTLSGRYTIAEAENGKKGYEAAVTCIPDLIISDVMMPEMDGFALCEKLKTNIATSHIPIILLTANASDESRMKGLETGADEYILKPFNAAALLIRIRKLIENRNKLRQIYSKQIVIEPSQITITSTDEAFVKKAVAIIEAHISDPEFDVDQFISEMAQGRNQLYKKIKEITGNSINEFIRSIRLKRAAQILKAERKTVAEVAYMVGFNYPEYFSKCFKKEFGVLPTDYPSKS